MSPALWLLLRLQLLGWVRSLTRGMRTLRGAVLLLVGVGVFLPWMAALFIGGSEGRVQRASLAEYGPLVLLLYCVVNVIFSPSDRAVYFSPAEVQFLFAGPFTRREVLVYKIVLALLVSLPVTLFLGAVVRVRDGWPPAVLLGLLMVSAFMQLFTLALGLLASAVGAGLYTNLRRLVGGGLVAVAALVVVEAGRRADWQWRLLLDQAIGTTAWRVASYPLRAFFDLMLAERLWPEMLVPLLITLAVNAALVALLLALDYGYQEASAASSARRYAALQRMRGRSVGAEPGRTRRSRWSMPALPYLGGVGPVLWRQLTGAMRSLGRLMLALVVIGSLLAFLLAGTLARESRVAMLAAGISLGVWLSVFLTTLVPFDFRGDLDRIALLKSLPIVPWRLAVGQLLTPALLLSGGQWLALAVVAALVPENIDLALAAAACVPFFNFALIALDNLLFLLFPVRLVATTPGDFQALGRNVLLSIGKLMGLGIILVLAAVPAAIVYALSTSVPLALLAAAPVWLACGALLVPLVALAFRRFDVGRDTPA